VLGYFGFGHVHHPEDFPDARFQSPACVVWPEDRPVALVLLALEKVCWVAECNPLMESCEKSTQKTGDLDGDYLLATL
jgi:hypothetical protein